MDRRAISLVILFGLVVTLPLANNAFFLALASRIIIFGILAISLDLILGYGGLVSFGHAAYFGTGAYVVGILTHYGITNASIHFSLAIVTAAAMGLVFGALSLRTRGIYFIMITLAFAQMLYFLAIGQQQFGGDDGMPLARRSDFGGLLNLEDPRQFYCFAVGVLGLTLYGLRRVVNSRFGLVLAGCRQNETRLLTIGVRVYWYKLTAFVIAAAIAGLAGALVANLNAYVSPNFLDWKISGTLMMMIVIGGIGTLYGPLLGAVIYLVLEELVSQYTSHWMAIFGPMLVLVALFWKQGVWAIVVNALASSKQGQPAPSLGVEAVSVAPNIETGKQ